VLSYLVDLPSIILHEGLKIGQQLFSGLGGLQKIDWVQKLDVHAHRWLELHEMFLVRAKYLAGLIFAAE
jgi:hypothetical protein